MNRVSSKRSNKNHFPSDHYLRSFLQIKVSYINVSLFVQLFKHMCTQQGPTYILLSRIANPLKPPSCQWSSQGNSLAADPSFMPSVDLFFGRYWLRENLPFHQDILKFKYVVSRSNIFPCIQYQSTCSQRSISAPEPLSTSKQLDCLSSV